MKPVRNEHDVKAVLQRQQRELYRTKGAALYTNTSELTLNKLRLTGGGPKYIKLGRTVLYDQADLDAWLNAHRRSSTSVAA